MLARRCRVGKAILSDEKPFSTSWFRVNFSQIGICQTFSAKSSLAKFLLGPSSDKNSSWVFSVSSPPPADYFPPPQSKLWLLLPVYMYLITEYVFRESVDSAHNSQISSTFQEADCLLKLVKINK